MSISRYFKTITTFAAIFFKRFFKDKTALFFTLAFPLIFLLVFGSIFSNQDQISFSVGLIDNSNTEFATEFVAQSEESEIFEIERFDDFELAETDLGRGELDVILVLPEDFGELKDNIPSGALTTYFDQADSQTAQAFSGAMQGILDAINQEFLMSDPPLTQDIQTIQTANLSSFDYLFAGMLGFAIMSLGIFGMANDFPANKKVGRLRRFEATPLRTSQLILGTMLYYLVLAVMSLGLMYIAGLIVFDFQMRGDFFNLFVFAIISTVSMFGFGLAIGGWAKNENQAAPISNLVAFPLMFLSGVFFPRFLMPEWLQSVSDYVPLTPIVDGTRLIITEGATILQLGEQLIVIGVWTIVIYTLAIKIFRWE